MDLYKPGIRGSYEDKGQACDSHEVSIGIMDIGIHLWSPHVLPDMDGIVESLKQKLNQLVNPINYWSDIK